MYEWPDLTYVASALIGIFLGIWGVIRMELWWAYRKLRKYHEKLERYKKAEFMLKDQVSDDPDDAPFV